MTTSVPTAKPVVWIINFYALPPGLATMFRHICFAREWGRRGYDVRLITASTIHNSDKQLDLGGESYAERDYDGLRFVHIKTGVYDKSRLKRMYELWRFPGRLRRIAKRLPRPDVVIHAAFVPFDGAMASLARDLGARYIVEIHDLWPASFVAFGLMGEKNPLYALMLGRERKLYHDADTLVFTMEGGRDYVEERSWHLPGGPRVELDKIVNVNQGIDLATFRVESGRSVPDALLDDRSLFKVVYVGSIRHANNMGVIVEAAKLLDERDSRAMLIIYGDGDKREALEQQAQSYGLSNIVFRGRVAPEDVPGILRRADATLFQFGETPLIRYGISPNKLFLYFAAGKPVLSTIRPAYDLVEKYQAGLSVAPDPTGIVEGVLELERASEARYADYCSGALRAAEDYDYARLASRMESLFALTPADATM